MRTRWMWIASAVVLAVVALTWVPLNRARWFSDGAEADAASQRAGKAAATGEGCPANAPEAKLDLTLKDMHGRDVRLADYKGKVVLLNFWATWCGPCRLEIPGFIELQDRYKKQGLVVLGLSIDDPPEKLPPFVDEFKMNYTVLVGRDRDDVMDAYGPIFGVPTTVLIGRNGKICSKHIGLASKAQFEKEIKGLL